MADKLTRIVTAKRPAKAARKPAQAMPIVARIVTARKPGDVPTVAREPSEEACADARAWLLRNIVPPNR
jgi:hypothetical protein